MRTVTLRREFLMRDLAIYAPHFFVLFLFRAAVSARAHVLPRPVFRLASPRLPCSDREFRGVHRASTSRIFR